MVFPNHQIKKDKMCIYNFLYNPRKLNEQNYTYIISSLQYYTQQVEMSIMGTPVNSSFFINCKMRLLMVKLLTSVLYVWVFMKCKMYFEINRLFNNTTLSNQISERKCLYI